MHCFPSNIIVTHCAFKSETKSCAETDIYRWCVCRCVSPACPAGQPALLLGPLVLAPPQPPSVLLLLWHFPYSPGTRVPHPGGEFSHTSVPCFPILLCCKGKGRSGVPTKVNLLYFCIIGLKLQVNKCTFLRRQAGILMYEKTLNVIVRIKMWQAVLQYANNFNHEYPWLYCKLCIDTANILPVSCLIKYVRLGFL